MRIPKHLVQPGSQASASLGNGPLTAFGTVPWTLQDQVPALDAFLPLFAERPIRDNRGGMRSVGLFNVWFLLDRLRPDAVLESGIWKGQSTWLIERALPGASIVSIDIDLGIREYVSPRPRYSQTDFLQLDLATLGWRAGGGLAFFDDHQDVMPRLRKCRSLGIRHVILDDNYPEFSGARHVSAAAVLNDRGPAGGIRFPGERAWLLENVEAYCVSPPIFDYREPLTLEKSYIATPSLLGPYDPALHARYETYRQDMPEYRWTTYLKLR